MKKYFEVYNQAVGKFALNFRLTNRLLNNWPQVVSQKLTCFTHASTLFYASHLYGKIVFDLYLTGVCPENFLEPFVFGNVRKIFFQHLLNQLFWGEIGAPN